MQLDASPRWQSSLVELFPLQPEHVSDTYVGWLNDPDVNRYLESRFVHHTRKGVEDFVAATVGDDRTLFLGIRSLVLDRHVGNIKLSAIDDRHGLGEVGIMIGDRGAWGLGIGSAAIRCLAKIALHELGLRKLTAGCYASNVGSVRAFEKAKFRIEGQRPDHFLLNGQPEGLVLLGHLLRRSEKA